MNWDVHKRWRRAKTFNPLDPRRGNFDSMRGWVASDSLKLRDPANPQSDWLIVVPALWLADLRVPRSSRSAIWLVKSSPSSVIGWFEGAKTQQNRLSAVQFHSLSQYWQNGSRGSKGLTVFEAEVPSHLEQKPTSYTHWPPRLFGLMIVAIQFI